MLELKKEKHGGTFTHSPLAWVWQVAEIDQPSRLPSAGPQGPAHLSRLQRIESTTDLCGALVAPRLVVNDFRQSAELLRPAQLRHRHRQGAVFICFPPPWIGAASFTLLMRPLIVSGRQAQANCIAQQYTLICFPLLAHSSIHTLCQLCRDYCRGFPSGTPFPFI